MIRKTLLLSAFICATFLLSHPANAGAGYDRLKAAGQGLNKDQAGQNSEGGTVDGAPQEKPVQHDDLIFLGVYETYVPTRRKNAAVSIFAEPRDFKFGHRACTKMLKIRDKINTYLFQHPPEMDKRGNVQTKGMDEGIRQAIKDGLRTKLEYFTSIYVFSGEWSTYKAPTEIKELGMTDCAGMIERKAEMDKASKK